MSHSRHPLFRTVSAAVAIGVIAVAVLLPQPAVAAPSQVAAGILADGTPPFDGTSGGGTDANATNAIVRTNDSVQYNFQYNFDGGGAANPVIRSELPVGMSWLSVPTECSRAGSSVSAGPNGAATVLTCNLPSATAAVSSRISPTALVSGASTVNVDALVRSVGFTLDDDGPAAALVAAPVDVTISRDPVPYFDVALTSVLPGTVPSVAGPNGPEPGVLLTFFWRVNSERPYPTAASGDTLRGVLPLTPNISFRHDLTGMPPFSTITSCNAVGTTSRGPNTSGGGAAGVTQSGGITCTREGDIAITGADTTMQHFPTSYGRAAISRATAITIPNSVVAAGRDGVAGTADDGSLPYTLTLAGFDPAAANGASNFGDGIEPLANNTLSGTAVISTISTFGKSFGGASDRRATTGSLVPARVSGTNQNFVPNEMMQCDVFDHTAYAVGGVPVPFVVNGTPGALVLEYGRPSVYPATTAELENANCGNADAYWSTDRTDPQLGGEVTADGFRAGIDRVRIRWTTPPANVQLGFTLPMRVIGTSDFNGVRLVNRGVQTVDGARLLRGQDVLTWTLGNLGITKTSVEQSAGTGNHYTAGNTIRFDLQPRVTIPQNGNPPGPVEGIIVTDILPLNEPRLTIAPGSVTQPAGVIAVEYCGECTGNDWSTTVPQPINGVRWLFGPTRAGTAMPLLSYRAITTVDTPNGTAYLNTATIDAGPAANVTPQSSTATVIVDAPSTVLASKVSNDFVIPVEGTASYSMLVRNNTATVLNHLDVIDVLPYDGDGRTPASVFGGGYRGIDVSGLPAGVTAHVTSLAPATLDLADGADDGYSDPLVPGNPLYVAPGNAAWACTLAAAVAGTAGCPAIADVTAVRFSGDRPGLLPALTTLSLNIDLATEGNDGGDVYTNRYTARVEASQLALPVRSSDASVLVVEPGVEVAYDVCIDADPAACDPDDDADWADAATVAGGGVGVFRVRVTNVGNDPATALVENPLPPGLTLVPGSAVATKGDTTGFPPRWNVGEIAPDGFARLTFQTTVAPGTTEVVNTATATFLDRFGQSVSDSDSVTITAETPQLELEKTITGYDDADGNGRPNSGDVISCSFRVTNVGVIALTAVAIDDALVADVTCPVTVLAPGDATTCTGTYTVSAADTAAGAVVNTATAEGAPVSGLSVISAPSTATQLLVEGAAIDLVKTGTLDDANGNGSADAGESIGYTFLVTNTGDVRLQGISVTDPKLGAVTCPAAGLAPSAQTTCVAAADWTITQAEFDAGVVRNAATVTGTPPGGEPVDDDATSEIPTTAGTTSLSLVKSVTPDSVARAGVEVRYSFVVTNTGTTTVTDVTIDEVDFSGTGVPPVVDCPTRALAPGDGVTCIADYEITQADAEAGIVTNTATATANAGDGLDDPVSAPSTAQVTIPSAPNLILDKSSRDASFAAVGDVVDYTFLVTNTGTRTLVDLVVDDDQIDAEAVCPVTRLAPTESTTCTGTHAVTQDDIDAGEIVNVASAAGVTLIGDPVTSPQDAVTVPGPDAVSALALDKSSTDASFVAEGDVVDFEFLVTNAGTVTLTDVAVADDLIDDPAECPVTELAPAESTTCVGSHTVVADDVEAGEFVNVATATAIDPSGEALVSAESAATVPGPAGAPEPPAGPGASAPGLSATGGGLLVGGIVIGLFALAAGVWLMTRRHERSSADEH